MLKSTREKLARQGERDSKIAFFEQQKENLKNIRADDLEGISRKLDMLHSYEDQITAARISYNQEQMKHMMDEAEERGEKMAEAAEKMEPKTPEERQKEMVDEALGIDENKSEIMESMEDLAEVAEDITEELTEDMTKDIAEELTEDMTKDITEKLSEDIFGDIPEKLTEDITQDQSAELMDERRYRRLDLYV